MLAANAPVSINHDGARKIIMKSTALAAEDRNKETDARTRQREEVSHRLPQCDNTYRGRRTVDPDDPQSGNYLPKRLSAVHGQKDDVRDADKKSNQPARAADPFI